MARLKSTFRKIHISISTYFYPSVAYCALVSAVLLISGWPIKIYRLALLSCREPVWAGLAPFGITIGVVWTWIYLFPATVGMSIAVWVWRRKRRSHTSAPQVRRALQSLGLIGVMAIASLMHAYLFWPVFTIDDGPYYARPFSGELSKLEPYSAIPLRRFGKTAYTLEVRLTQENPVKNVFVLRDAAGQTLWAEVPICQKYLGRIRLNEQYTRVTWWGGWSVAIRPERQEGGRLYLGPLGGYRYFYHSW